MANDDSDVYVGTGDSCPEASVICLCHASRFKFTSAPEAGVEGIESEDSRE